MVHISQTVELIFKRTFPNRTGDNGSVLYMISEVEKELDSYFNKILEKYRSDKVAEILREERKISKTRRTKQI